MFSWNIDYLLGALRENLCNALLTTPVLQIADTSRPFRVVSIASHGDKAIGAIVLQQDHESKWRSR